MYMKKYLPFFLLFLYLIILAGCGQARRTYVPAIITSSRIILSSAFTQTIENSIEDTSHDIFPVASENFSQTQSVISSTVNSKKSSITSAKINSAVSSTLSQSFSSQQNSTNSILSSTSSTSSSDEKNQSIVVVSLTSPIVRGQDAKITVKGKPDVEYIIKVIYKSGPSKAKGLEPKTSELNGMVTWTWKVSAQTTAGSWSIEITGGESALTVPFVVTE